MGGVDVKGIEMRLELLPVVLLALVALAHGADDMPPPFTRVLSLQNPPMTGNDVVILQNLIGRSPFVSINVTDEYDSQTATAVADFQKGNSIPSTPGVFDAPTANRLLALHSCDAYVDPNTSAGSLGYLYKFHVSVFSNRSWEHTGFLFDANNTLLHQFRVRTHGQDEAGAAAPWPAYSNTYGLNQFTSNGNTPTGFAECDLNSPEPNATLYGPFPVNRVINGIDGNAKFILAAKNPIRSGILLHTGLWPDWTPDEDMPNSDGCLHAHPRDIETIWKLLVSIGVEVRDNPFGEQPYPYKPQGLMVVQQVGCQ